MTPGNYTIRAYRGDTLQLTFTITDGSNVAIDLSTAAVLMQVRTHPDGELKMTFAEGDGLTVGGAGNNVVTVSKVVALDGCAYQYDLQATFATGVVVTYVRGAFIVTEDITT